MKHLYNKRFQWSFIIILISWSFFVFNIASSEDSPSPESKDPLAYEIQLDDREKAWLENHKKVRIGTSQYPPLTYMDDSGIMIGISADYLKQISERTGLKFEAEYFVWADLMKQSKNKGIDMFSGLKNSEREKYLNFTNPYLQVSYVVINRIKTPFLGDFSILNGQKVAVVKDWTVHKLMQKDFPKIKIVPFNSVPEALTAVSNSRVEAYVGDLLTASYQIQKNVLTNLKVAASAPFRNDSVRFAVRKDWPELTTILDKAIHSLSREEHDSCIPIRHAEHSSRGASTGPCRHVHRPSM
jgi:ABC-type amino acid transport substrate-binding protein